jgi:peroxiredoxin
MPATSVPVGAEAPDFTLASPGHGTITLSDYRERTSVLLVFLRGFG